MREVARCDEQLSGGIIMIMIKTTTVSFGEIAVMNRFRQGQKRQHQIRL